MKTMRESFLHFLLSTRRFDAQNLKSSTFQSITVHHVGEQNTHAGPDFFNARITIGDTYWAGNIEMHLYSSEWHAHKHCEDRAYDNVVLHIVLVEDVPILRANGERIPCLELYDRIPPSLLENYERLEREQSWIPCEHFFDSVPTIVRLNWLDRVMIERLELKTKAIETALIATENHWEEAFYRLLARNFGLKVNAEPFEALARSIPLVILAKHKTSLLQLEALLFGQAGFLNESFSEEWPQLLAREYRHLSHKYGLVSLPKSQWKFLRMRPTNFPTVRLAQFAALLHQTTHLFSKVLETTSLTEVERLFEIETSAFWRDHYQFGKASVQQEKRLSRDFIHLIVINTVAPFLFHFGKSRALEAPPRRALELLEQLPAESNSMLEGWINLGFTPQNAFQSQALIQLKTRYCDEKKCLDCAIAAAILK